MITKGTPLMFLFCFAWYKVEICWHKNLVDAGDIIVDDAVVGGTIRVDNTSQNAPIQTWLQRIGNPRAVLSSHSSQWKLELLISFFIWMSNKGPYGLLQVAYSDIHRHADNIHFRNTPKTNIKNGQHDNCANADKNLCKVKSTML